ncbi:hypothetical protein Trydic_g6422 [Trypoxylus dichotomus]
MRVIIKTGQVLLIIPSYLQRDTHPWQAYVIFFAAITMLLALNVLSLWTRKRRDKAFLRSVKIKIRNSIQDYIAATKQVDSFNKLFGIGIFFYYLNLLVDFVLGVNNGFILLNERTVDEEDVEVKKVIVALCFAFAVMELLAGIKLAMTCRDVMTKLLETGDIVFETLQEFSVMDDCAIALGIRHELVIFCKHTMDVQPFFSAGGFFKIDRTFLTDIINSVITYIVMLAQLNKTLST